MISLISSSSISHCISLSVSDDPGRFLCNYVYYRSLERAGSSVFIHVPPLQVVGLDEQVRFVKSFLEIVAVHFDASAALAVGGP